MLRIAICDDSSFMRDAIREKLLQYSFQNNVDFEIDEYESGEMFLEDEIEKNKKHDLVFIDYEFEEKGKNGIDIITKFREFQKDTKVVFISSYAQMVFQSFEVETFRFLTKPLEKEKLFKALDDFRAITAKDFRLSVNADGETFFFQESNISYIEGFGKNSIIHFSDARRDFICNETLGAIENRLSCAFFRCHKSFLVNMSHVESYNHANITLDHGDEVVISRMKYKEFKEQLADYHLGRRGL